MATQPIETNVEGVEVGVTAPATSSLGDNPVLAGLRLAVSNDKPAKKLAAKKPAAAKAKIKEEPMPKADTNIAPETDNLAIRDKHVAKKGKNKPQTEPTEEPKKVMPRQRRSRSETPADTRPAIERLMNGKPGVPVDFTEMVVRADIEPGKDGERRKLTVMSGDLAGTFVWSYEVENFSLLGFKPGSDQTIYDKVVRLHDFLRALALENGLAKEDARPQRDADAEARTLAKLDSGQFSLNPPQRKLTRSERLALMEHDHSPEALVLPKVYAGIEGLLEAPVDRKVKVGEFTFRVEVRERDEGEDQRRYVVSQAPDRKYMDIWVGHWELQRRSPRITEKMSDGLSEMKIELHTLLRNAAVDAGIITGGYAHKYKLVTDEAAVIASIKDGVIGLYELEHPEYPETARVLIEEDDRNHKQVILLSGKGEWFSDAPPLGVGEETIQIRPGVRLSTFWLNQKKRPNPAWTEDRHGHIIQLYNWLYEAVYYR